MRGVTVSVTDLAVTIGAVATAVVALVALGRKSLKAYKTVKADGRAFKDAVLGRDAMIHPETGEVVVPAVPGLGTRMATIEEAVVKMADTHVQVEDLRNRVTVLEQKELERALARTESIELMRTIDAALKAQPEEN